MQNHPRIRWFLGGTTFLLSVWGSAGTQRIHMGLQFLFKGVWGTESLVFEFRLSEGHKERR